MSHLFQVGPVPEAWSSSTCCLAKSASKNITLIDPNVYNPTMWGAVAGSEIEEDYNEVTGTDPS
jgi:hypothetical protein